MVFSFVFRAFKAGPSDTLIDDLYYSFAMYGGLGIGILLVQFASVRFHYSFYFLNSSMKTFFLQLIN